MRRMKSLTAIAVIGAMVLEMGGVYGGSAYAGTTDEQEDNLSKITDCLLEKYGVTKETLPITHYKNTQNTQTVPVIVWNTNEIDHEAAEKVALSALFSNVDRNRTGVQLYNPHINTLDDILVSDIELSVEDVQAFIEAERAAAREMYAELNSEFIREHLPDAEISFVSEYSPIIIAELTFDEVLELAESDETLILDSGYEEGDGEDPLDISTEATKAKTVQTNPNYGYTGDGVKIGQLEYAIPELDNSQLSPISTKIHRSGTSNAGNHATFVACIMVGQSDGTYSTGMAPDAELYSASCAHFNYNDYAAIEWLISYGVNVINASHAVGHSTEHNTYNTFAKWLDHIAVEHRVTFVQSSGNDSVQGIISGAMAYNIITVGNANDKNTISVTDDVINSGSSYYNENTHLAYKPDLCAPGTGIKNAANSVGASGTSASAPHITGAIALLFEAKPTLMIRPAVVKALLTAAVSPESNHRYTPGDSGYRQYGAGLLDIYRVIESAQKLQFRTNTLTPTNNSDSYNLNIPTTGSTVRVSLTFLKNNYAGTSHVSENGIVSDPVQDLDLWVYAPDGTLVDSSMMLYNNVEIIEFTSTHTGTYTIKTMKTSNSYETPVTYGIAWMEAN